MTLSDVLATNFLPFWPFLLSLALASVVLYIRSINSEIWSLILRSAFSPRATSQLIREENVMENTYSGWLVVVFFLSVTLFLHNIQGATGLSIINYPVLTFLFIFFLLSVIYISKIGLVYLVQLVFESRELFNEYLVFFMNINILMGLILIPLNLLFVYGFILSKTLIASISIGIFAATLLLRYIRIYEMGMRYRMNWYNIILYLCTLEILPVVLIMTLLNNIGISLNLDLINY